MKLALLTALALNAAASFADDDDAAGIRGAIRDIPTLFGAEQLVDVERRSEIQPDYCYEEPDWYCYKKGHPKCCTKDKGNCPNNKQPGCECGDRDCNPDMENDDRIRDPKRCFEDDECERDEYCRFREGDCGNRQNGFCEDVPERCSREKDPVCGCNGRTYSNDCVAAAAEVSIKYYGECEDGNDNPSNPSACVEDNDCDRDEYCRFQVGRCGRGDGICEEIPERCSREKDPVCGCNGREYSNDCLAAAAEVSIKYYGECEESDDRPREPTNCEEDNDCGRDEYCRFEEGRCGRGDGICEEIPERCSREEDPVCGCNDREYSNDCLAAAAEVSVKYYGQCEENTCMEDDDCGRDEFCKTQTGTCGAREGLCKPMPGPGACTFEFDPVCGCDGREYSNDCDAEAAGVSIKYYGQCEDSGPTVCVKDNDCDRDEYCFFQLATCGARDGICKQVPDPGACPMDYDPVCGCNGRNDCVAADAGVSIKYYGEC